MPVDIFGRTTGVSEETTTNQITIGQLNAEFLRRDGNNTAEGDIGWGLNRIINLGEPVGLADATTKKYVDDTVGAADYLRLDGSTPMIGPIDMSLNAIRQVTTPVSSTDAATKGYVDTAPYLKLDGTSAMTGNLNLANNFAIGMLDPIIAQDGATKKYVDDNIAAVNASLSTIIATSTVANVSVASSNTIAIGTALTPVVLVLDPAKPNNPSEPTIINCTNGSTFFRIFEPGTFSVGYNALFSNSTTTQITINAYLRRLDTSADLITIPPIICSARPTAAAPNTTTSFIINNQFTLSTIPVSPGYVDVSIFTQASATGVSSLYRDGFLALSITQDSTAYLPLSGGTMTGTINMNTQAITNLKTPAIATDAATKGYVDSKASPIVDAVYFKRIGVVGATTKLPWQNTNVSSNFSTYFSKDTSNGDYLITNSAYEYKFILDVTATNINQKTEVAMDNSISPFGVIINCAIPPDQSTNTNTMSTVIKTTGGFNFYSTGWDNLNAFNVTVLVLNPITYTPVP